MINEPLTGLALAVAVDMATDMASGNTGVIEWFKETASMLFFDYFLLGIGVVIGIFVTEQVINAARLDLLVAIAIRAVAILAAVAIICYIHPGLRGDSDFREAFTSWMLATAIWTALSMMGRKSLLK